MHPRVRILNVSRVHLPPPALPPPGATVPLSFFDVLWVTLPPIQRVFLFPDAGHGASLSSLAGALRSALLRTLPFFHPLAGRLLYRLDAGDVVVDCSATNAAPGVALVEAAASSDLDVSRLATDEDHDVESFLELVPNIAAAELPAPVMAVQVTSFARGGAAVGIAVHHAVADGNGVWRFLEALAEASRAPFGSGEVVQPSVKHDRAVVRVPGGDELKKRFLRRLAPELPRITRAAQDTTDRLQLTRRTFVLSSSAIRRLKQQAVRQTTAAAGATVTVSPPSTFVAVSAHAWTSIARARGLDKDDGPLTLIFLVDCRARLKPPVDDSFTGNCVRSAYARAAGSELADVACGHARACAAIQRAVKEVTEALFEGCERWLDRYAALPKSRTVHVSGSPRFPVYATDFGWGRPGRVELVSVNHDGEVVLVAGKEEGSVQASVAMSAGRMQLFSDIFSGGIASE